MAIFRYGQQEVDYLRGRCPILGGAMEGIGLICREVEPDLFTALIRSIVAQQISNKALVTIWDRMRDRLSPISPKTIAGREIETIQQCGISLRKATYIQEAARTILRGELDINRLHDLPDEQVCIELVRLKGIGIWTAEMLMIFSMQRPNIFSYGDLAIHRGLRMLYRHRAITEQLFAKYRRRFAPYASIASLYLWAIAGGDCEGFVDPAGRKKTLKLTHHLDLLVSETIPTPVELLKSQGKTRKRASTPKTSKQ